MSAASDTNTLTDFLATQDALQREAALALPHSFSACTYSRGAIRQPIYLCRTCAVPRGVCAACSIACHPSHEQLELFPKRNFICDCPTTSIPHPCTLHQREEGENIGNSYAKNFRGEFCRCGRDYDAMEEVETMIQCLACEDWFHESCLNLRERPPPEPEPESSPLESAVQPSEPSALPIDSIAQLSESLTSSRSADSIVQPSESAVQDGDDVDDDDALSTTSTILPPPLLSASDYDAFVCSACVRDIPLLQHYTGTHGARIVLRSSPREPWRMHEGGRATEAEKVDIDGESTEKHNEVGQKRALSPDDSSSAKRPRLGHDEPRAVSESTPPSSTCLKPPADPVAQRIYAHLPDDTSLGAGDVFLTEGWRQRWCRCSDCLPQLQTRPYLLEEEETYEPPEDPDSQFSLEELGMRALSRLPRDRAIDGIHAFNTMRDGLMQFLRPFAQEGKVVGEEDIRRFFDGKPGSGGRNI